MDTIQIRKEVKLYRNSLDEATISRMSQVIQTSILHLLETKQDVNHFLCYYPLKGEVNLLALYETLLEQGNHLYFPKTYKSFIEFYEITSLRDFKEGTFHVMEPSDISKKFQSSDKTICFAPGLAFSEKKQRIGYGGGYYDRYLKDKSILKIGTCFQRQIYEFESENHDIPMDLVVTDQCIIN
ncbi:MAG: 5-formyltetrahydrofolate cyclo-ligase [Lachnospiraceae bacterium]|nr:5-formyltetrahydrofolate cyclo-ligase [Lachnospiraceae bacterium]